ncbi:Oxidoreductase BOA17 [Psilocybe cubensis]|uniref:Uncharacterized protein n=2 Tax=Psilocybe cubensis TaxID=181762 RepID=A0A8H8CH21_PSICU|nr:Oxidoreductase BOA17 [Psilocybe cubensis]KAH9477887.1 Oxidoreductase BOA17 [Psilocybe cubensis]
MPAAPLVWLITGCSSGIGRALAIAAIKRGDLVIATTRAKSFDTIRNLTEIGAHIMELDVTASLDHLKEVAAEAVKVYGRVDVVMNNAGFALRGSLEETSHEDSLAQFNTNLFGALNVSRTFLPHMRERGTGTICFIGSCFGWAPFPFTGLYNASKFALRGMADTLNQEISQFGLRSICFDSGCFRTQIIDHIAPIVSNIDAYNEAGHSNNTLLFSLNGKQKGDPERGVNVIIDVVKREGLAAVLSDDEIPSGFALGQDCYNAVKEECEKTLARLEKWKALTFSTDYPDN